MNSKQPFTVCPKCGYARNASEHAPAWQCPQCGIAYGKYREPGARDAESAAGVSGRTTQSASSGFRRLRIAVLSFVLIMVALNAWLTRLRTTDWDHPLRAVVYPINIEGGTSTADYIATLTPSDFAAIEHFMAQQAARYGITLSEPVEVNLAPPLTAAPPLPPQGGNIAAIIGWSLELRYWAWRVDNYEGPNPDIRLFILYHPPAPGRALAHSVGLKEGLIGLVHAFATGPMRDANNVVIAHEMLHTLGATDKYDPATNLPLYPQGYADPSREPRLPQDEAEIMGGRIPISAHEARMPNGLEQTVVGAETAREIGWIE